mgnify:CR=1 FL=1
MGAWRMGIMVLAVFAAGGMHWAAPAQPPAERLWPTFRHDAQLTGRSPLTGDFPAAPAVAWRHDLHANQVPVQTPYFADYDGDQMHEVLIRTRNSLTLLDADGSVMWEKTGLSRPGIVYREDFAGNGSLGIVITTSDLVTATYWIIDSVTGTMTELFKIENSFGMHVRYGSILPGVPGMQLALFWTGDPPEGREWPGHGYLWSFEDGCDHPRKRFETHIMGYLISPLMAFEDFDRNGTPDLYVVGHEHVQVWDLQTGETLYEGFWHDEFIRNYSSTLGVIRFPGRDYPSLLMINPHLPGAYVVDLKDGKPVRRWKQVVGPLENQYQRAVEIDPGASDAYCDLDGDGVPEMLARVRNEHQDGQDRLVIWRAEDGERLYDGAWIEIVSVEDLDGAAPPEILIQGDGGLEIGRWNGNAIEIVDTLAGTEPVFAPPAPLRDPTRFSPRAQFSNPHLWRPSPEASTFFLKDAGGVFVAELNADGQLRKVADAPADHPATGFVPVAERMKTTLAAAGNLHQILQEGQVLHEVEITSERQYLAPPALVGALGGAVRILAKTAEANIESITPAGESDGILLKQHPATAGLHVEPTCLGSILDVDGDGENEFLSSTAAGGPAIVAVDAAGQEKLRIAPAGPLSELVLVATGKRNDQPGNWIVARWQTEPKTMGVAWFVSGLGIDGSPLWQRTGYGMYQGEPTQFLQRAPTAVADYNADGGDDLFVSSENFFGIMAGTDGTDLLGPKNILDKRPDDIWPAYSTPILVDLDGAAPPEMIHARSFGSTYVATWESEPLLSVKLSRDTTARRFPAAADLDGNGALEVITSQLNGLLIAYNVLPPSGTPGERWRHPLPGTVSDLISADLDDDGREELLVGCEDGRLYALREDAGQCAVLWSVDLGAAVGSPILADMGEAGGPAILVPTEDGWLYCLR